MTPRPRSAAGWAPPCARYLPGGRPGQPESKTAEAPSRSRTSPGRQATSRRQVDRRTPRSGRIRLATAMSVDASPRLKIRARERPGLSIISCPAVAMNHTTHALYILLLLSPVMCEVQLGALSFQVGQRSSEQLSGRCRRSRGGFHVVAGADEAAGLSAPRGHAGPGCEAPPQRRRKHCAAEPAAQARPWPDPGGCAGPPAHRHAGSVQGRVEQIDFLVRARFPVYPVADAVEV